MNRITDADLRRKFEYFREANRAAGITRILTTWSNNNHGESVLTADNLGLDYGSKTYGRPFRVFYINPEGGGHYGLSGASDYLGMTKREAYNTLHALTQGIYLALDARAERGE